MPKHPDPDVDRLIRSNASRGVKLKAAMQKLAESEIETAELRERLVGVEAERDALKAPPVAPETTTTTKPSLMEQLDAGRDRDVDRSLPKSMRGKPAAKASAPPEDLTPQAKPDPNASQSSGRMKL